MLDNNLTRRLPLPTRLALSMLGTLWLLALASNLPASEYLGVLSELTQPESKVAKQLDLSEQQIQQLKQLTSRRTSAAVGLAAQLKEAPKNQHGQLLADFATESERLAAGVLDQAQRDQLKQLKLQWQGLLSLSDPAVAQAVNLAPWQQETVSSWRERLRTARKANSQDGLKPQAEQAIRAELSDSQWDAWQVLAGLSNQQPAQPPMPPVREGLDSAPPSPPTAAATAPALPAAGDVSQIAIDQVQLEINFQRQPWGDVIRWLAEQADMSVHSEVTPPGTFTYRDLSRKYTVGEVLDVMNAYLLDSGYSLFRQGRLLRCVNFEDDQAMRGELLKELTETISEAELANRGRYEPVRVLFSLQRLNPDDVIDQVLELLSVQGTAVSLVTSGQLLVTDMAGNVRNVADFLQRAEDPASARGAAVQSFVLQSITAEEVLSVARPLLDLESDSNVSEGIKLSTNTFGTMIFARGEADKIQILRDLVKQMDKAPDATDKPITYETPYVGRHLVRGIDLKLAYEVAAQLLAGSPDVKLATDETAKQLVLMGRKGDHQLIQETLDSLAGELSDFKVIPLQNLDTQMAIAAVKKFFGLPDKPDAASGQPVIDGDSVARQLWVKGSASQVQQIEDLIQKLEGTAKAGKSLWGDHLRILPGGGSGTADAMRQAEIVWQQINGNQNPIIGGAGGVASSGLKSQSFAPQRSKQTTAPASSDSEESTQSRDESSGKPSGESKEEAGSAKIKQETEAAVQSVPEGRLVASAQEANEQQGADSLASDSSEITEIDAASTTPPYPNSQSSGAPIVVRESPNGLMVTSEDTAALDRFENLLRMIMEQSALNDIEPQVVYLQNIKAAAAKQLLSEILSGSPAKASEGGGGSGGGGLLGGMASNLLGGLGGGMLGSLLGGGANSAGGSASATVSSVGMATGQYAIVSDPRLNALFIKAQPPDMRLIEQLLRVIDQIESPFSVETQGVTELIPVLTQDVNDVLTTVKSVFGERIVGNASSTNRAPAGGAPSNPGEFFQAMRSAFGGGGGSRGQPQPAQVDLSEPKISIGADLHTNTLVVIAQPYQIDEVRKLVGMLDEAGESEQPEVAVVEMGAITSDALSTSLQRMLGEQAQTNVSGGSSGSSGTGSNRSSGSGASASGSAGQFDVDAARRRAEFFMQMLQGRGSSGSAGNSGAGSGNSRRGTGGSRSSRN
jgi:type II secretory pathway component GspD/PulD (secretin)